MDALTVSDISNTFGQVRPNLNPHATTIAYVRSLLAPYAEVIEQATSIEGIEQWLPQALPTILSEHAASELSRAVTKATIMIIRDGNTIIDDEGNPVTDEIIRGDILNVAKNAVIEYLVAELAEISGRVAQQEGDYHIILPWDVLKAIGNDPEFSTLLGITPQHNTLPVTVTIGGKDITYNMSVELAMGILVFEDASNNINFQLSMFGIRLFLGSFIDRDDIESFRYIGQHVQPDTFYTVNVNEITYRFKTPEFMQGVATGASWIGVDHHKYWNDLFSYNTNSDGQHVITRITF